MRVPRAGRRKVRPLPCFLSLAVIAAVLTACGGGSGASSDVNEVSSAAMQKGDLPASLTVNGAQTFNTFAAYSGASATNFGHLGSHCGQGTTAQEQANFVSGLAQTALDAQGLGVKECVQVLNNDGNAKAEFDSALSQLNSSSITKENVDQVGDQTLAGSVSKNGVVAHIVSWRHGNTLISLEFLNTQDTLSIDQLHTAANNIDGRLK